MGVHGDTPLLSCCHLQALTTWPLRVSLDACPACTRCAMAIFFALHLFYLPICTRVLPFPHPLLLLLYWICLQPHHTHTYHAASSVLDNACGISRHHHAPPCAHATARRLPIPGAPRAGGNVQLLISLQWIIFYYQHIKLACRSAMLYRVTKLTHALHCIPTFSYMANIII